MRIRIATWNMAYWSHKPFHKESWNYFTNELNCDILLFQESVPDFETVHSKNTVWNKIGGNRDWGSGVYTSSYSIKEISIDTKFIGCVTATEIEINKTFSLIVISVYGLMEKIQNVTYAIPNLHRIFSDLTGIIESRSTKNRLIIGGDLNASLQIDELQTGNSHKVFFDRLKEFQLINCFDNYYQDFVQTHRHRRSDRPWQNDYFFISKKLEKSLTNCEVIYNETVGKLSDHNPIIIELRI